MLRPRQEDIAAQLRCLIKPRQAAADRVQVAQGVVESFLIVGDERHHVGAGRHISAGALLQVGKGAVAVALFDLVPVLSRQLGIYEALPLQLAQLILVQMSKRQRQGIRRSRLAEAVLPRRLQVHARQLIVIQSQVAAPERVLARPHRGSAGSFDLGLQRGHHRLHRPAVIARIVKRRQRRVAGHRFDVLDRLRKAAGQKLARRGFAPAETALTLTTRDLRLMERLARAQVRKAGGADDGAVEEIKRIELDTAWGELRSGNTVFDEERGTGLTAWGAL